MLSKPCHLTWSFALIFLILKQNNATGIWNIRWRVESFNGNFEQILQNSVKYSAFQIVSYQLNHISKVLKLIEGYICTIWISLGLFLSILKISVECSGRFRVFQIVSFKVLRVEEDGNIANLSQYDKYKQISSCFTL